MKHENFNMANSAKKRAMAISMCGALALMLGTGSVYAASSQNKDSVANATYIAQANGDVTAATAREQIIFKNENGVTSYSTDDGKTWTEGVPEGMPAPPVDANGKMLPPPNGAMGGVMFKDENGVQSYSTDGGETWTEGVPENMPKPPVDADGNPIAPPDGGMMFHTNGVGGNFMVKNENGITSYSSDDGKTWTEGVPEGMPAPPVDANGKMLPPPGHAMGGVMLKDENGVQSYSTNGGETWTEGVPENMPKPPVDADGNPIAPPDGGMMFHTNGVAGNFMVKNENGVQSYSTDGGETWTEGVPENMPKPPVDADGNPIAPPGGGVMFKDENGVQSYSTDGGKTWAEGVPEGFKPHTFSNGSVETFSVELEDSALIS